LGLFDGFVILEVVVDDVLKAVVVDGRVIRGWGGWGGRISMSGKNITFPLGLDFIFIPRPNEALLGIQLQFRIHFADGWG
jgi:hypothetical protein